MSSGEMNEATTRPQLGIIGAGPTRLLIGNLLGQAGVECIIVERQSRDSIEHRARAGLIEHWVVAFLRRYGLANRLLREGRHTTAVSSPIADSTSASRLPPCTEATPTP